MRKILRWKQCREHHCRRTAVDKNHDFSFAELCRCHGWPLGIADRREQPDFARKQPRHKIAGIQQKFRSGGSKRFSDTGHHGRVSLIPAVAHCVFRFSFSAGLLYLLHKVLCPDEPSQQAQVDPQEVGKTFPRTAQIALAGRFFHRTGLQTLHRKGNAFCAAVQQQHRHTGGQTFDKV